jgi:hypothetical protein
MNLDWRRWLAFLGFFLMPFGDTAWRFADWICPIEEQPYDR